MELHDVVDRYCAAWNETDADRRAALLASVWAQGATYMDPTVGPLDAPALLAHIARIQGTRPGATLVRSTGVDEHHGVARFGFRVTGEGGALLREGTDIVFLSADRQRVERIVGFFGALTPGQAGG